MKHLNKIVLFAKATEREAVDLATSVVGEEKMAIAEVVIVKGFIPAEPVCWIALPERVLKALVERERVS